MAVMPVPVIHDLPPSPPIFQSPKRKQWDAILALEKPTNTLKLERDEIIEQVISKVYGQLDISESD